MTTLSSPAELDAADTDEWWKTSSTAELKQIVAVGVAAGDRFDSAVREIERRSRDTLIRSESLQAEKKRHDVQRHRKLRMIAMLAALAVAIVFLLVAEGYI